MAKTRKKPSAEPYVTNGSYHLNMHTQKRVTVWLECQGCGEEIMLEDDFTCAVSGRIERIEKECVAYAQRNGYAVVSHDAVPLTADQGKLLCKECRDFSKRERQAARRKPRKKAKR